MEDKDYTHRELIGIFDQVRNKVLDLNYEYENLFTYIGPSTIRVSIKGISKGSSEGLLRRLTAEYPKYIVAMGFRERTVLVFIKGPGNNSPYNKFRR